MGQVIYVPTKCPLGHPLVLLASTVLLLDTVGIANKQLSYRFLATELYDFGGPLVLQIRTPPLATF